MTKDRKYITNRCKEARYDAATMICPFSWVEVMKPKEYFSLLFEERAKAVVQPEPCLLSRCKMFDASKGVCKLLIDD